MTDDQTAQMTDDNAPDGVLAGVLVVDLTWSWAGPLTTRILADLGAEVIKVEGVTRPDWTRFLYCADNEPGDRPWESGGFFHELNRNKRSLTLDLSAGEGLRLLRDLIDQADVVIESFTPRVKVAWGLEYETLRQRNEGLIMASLSGFGQAGPYRDYLAFGPTMEAMSGITSLGGHPDGPPERVGVMYGDPVMGMAAAAAVLTALYERSFTGRGAYLDVCGTEASMAIIPEAFAYAAATGPPPARTGSTDEDAILSGCFPCAGDDEWIAVSCPGPAELAGFSTVLGLSSPPSSSSGENAYRVIAERTHAWTAEALADAVQQRGIPAAKVAYSSDLHTDPHLDARGLHLLLDHPVVGTRTTTGSAFPSSGLERCREMMRAAPLYGRDTHEILRTRLGLSDEAIERLATAGIIASQPKVPQFPGPAPIALWRQVGLIR